MTSSSITLSTMSWKNLDKGNLPTFMVCFLKFSCGKCCFQALNPIFRGFSTVLLVEHARTRKRYAVKRIICHGRDDQKCALQEVEYHKILSHPNIIPCLEYAVSGCPDPVLNTTSQVLLLLPYYSVCYFYVFLLSFCFVTFGLIVGNIYFILERHTRVLPRSTEQK